MKILNKSFLKNSTNLLKTRSLVEQSKKYNFSDYSVENKNNTNKKVNIVD